MTIKTLKMVRFGPYIKETVVDFEQFTGKVFLVSGDTGAGKTTIINILNGYLKPRSGECYLLGENMNPLTPATKAKIGLLLEGHVQHTYFTIEQIEKYP